MPRPLSEVDPSIVTNPGSFIGEPGPPGGGGGGVPPGTTYTMPLAGGESGQCIVPGVAATPGWNVIDAFKYVVNQHVVTPPGTVTRIFSATVIASTAALTVKLKLVQADTLVDVVGSTLTFAAPVNVTEQTLETADLTANLTSGVMYQVLAECTGGAGGGDFATIRSTSVRAVILY
jgi:hypothetical protein